MSPPTVWGPAVWALIHKLSTSIRDEQFQTIFPECFSFICRICAVLPCPECSRDATDLLRRINVQTIKSKQDFINVMGEFHNKVNAKKGKPLYPIEGIVGAMESKLFRVVIQDFIQKYNTNGIMTLMADAFQRKKVLQDFIQWLKSRQNCFM